MQRRERSFLGKKTNACVSRGLVPLAFTLVFASGASGLGCKRHDRPPTNVGIAAPLTLDRARFGKPPPDLSPPGVDEHVLLALQGPISGPLIARARSGDALLGAYLGTNESGARRLVAIPLSAAGALRKDSRMVVQVTPDSTGLVLKPTGGDGGGFAAAWTSLTDRGEALSLVGLDANGAARGEVTELARTTDHLLWVDVVPTSRGAVALWAEETRAGDANVLAAPIGPGGALSGVPARIARGVNGWQVVEVPGGVGVLLASEEERPAPVAATADVRRPVPGRPRDGAKGTRSISPREPTGADDAPRRATRRLAWLKLDETGAAVAPPLDLARHVVFRGDLELGRAGGSTLVAWTDPTEADPRVMIAAVDDAGNVHPPQRAVAVNMGSQLVGLTSGEEGALLAYSDPFLRGGGRRVSFAAVAPAAVGVPGIQVDSPRALTFDLEGDAVPIIAKTAGGFAWIAPARACLTSPCRADAQVMPTLVRLGVTDGHLAVTGVDPLRLGAGRVPAQSAWGLTCVELRCVAFATGAESPPVVRAVDLAPRPLVFRPPLETDSAPGVPHVESVATVATGVFTDLAVTRVGKNTLVALLGAGLDDPRARRDGDGTGAPITVQKLDASGAASSAPAPLSPRAMAVGGVAIAAAGRPEDGAAVAWVAREAGDPQVHVTRVDAAGHRTRDVQLTTATGDASDVAIGWVEGGWIVAWVDARDGNGEVYATKVDLDLRRIAREERITRAPGDASDVTLLVTPSRVWLAWADPRESPGDGSADIYLSALHPRDASPFGPEVRVLSTAAHSRSPALALSGDQLAVGWIEEAPVGANPRAAQAYGALLAWVDANGHPLREPGRIPIAATGFSTALTLAGDEGRVRGVLARSTPQGIELDAVQFTREAASPATRLLRLDAPPSLDVTLVLGDEALYFNDDGDNETARRARRARLGWAP